MPVGMKIDGVREAGDDRGRYSVKALLPADVIGLFVLLREVAPAVQKAAGVSEFNIAYGGPAGLRFFQELDKLGQQIGQGEADRALTKAAINVGGVVFHLPAGQINRTIDGTAAIIEGKTANPAAVVVGYQERR